MELTNMQRDAIERCKRWFKEGSKQVFVIAGYAGTGKTEVVKQMVESLGIVGEVIYTTYTGKAASVLLQRGCNATNIHGIFYRFKGEDESEEIRALEEELDRYLIIKATGGRFDSSLEELIDKTRKKIEKLGCKSGSKKLIFEKVDRLDPNVSLIVVDEVSMVDQDIFDDLLSFGIPIIAIGDPAQLPPVGKEVNRYLKNHDVFLTEIHRQAQDNPIVYLSGLVRKGKNLQIRDFGKSVKVVSKADVIFNPDVLMSASQVICCRNDTRRSLNLFMRKCKGIHTVAPVVGDKVFCRRNNRSLITKGFTNSGETMNFPLVNGAIGYITNIWGRSYYMEDSFAENSKISEALSDLNSFFDGLASEDRKEDFEPVCGSGFACETPSGLPNYPEGGNCGDFYDQKYNSGSPLVETPDIPIVKLDFQLSFTSEPYKDLLVNAEEFFGIKANMVANYHANIFDYGYAITCHKAQGSEFSEVLYIHEPFGDSVKRRQLAYTAITRATDKLIVGI